eukprot:scaffold545813_cov48-Prasinocladus_malaysianus.AAC.1
MDIEAVVYIMLDNAYGLVVGDQSHGKSSLLEALSGVKLPRGEGMKTRVPLVMKLRRLNEDQKEYAQISAEGDDSAQQIKLSDTAEAVDRVTERIAGDPSSMTIKSQYIQLEVFRHHQDDLTLVDLPGITRVAADGGDGEALERKIKQMALKYIEPAESVVLNVVSAMVDLATSAAVQMSLKVDPGGERSLLCVTMVDRHTEDGLAAKITRACEDMRIAGNCVFAVCNKWKNGLLDLPGRAQRENEAQHLRPLADAGMAASSLGLQALTKRLVAIQCERIKQTLPSTLKDIHERRMELEQKATSLGEAFELQGDASCRMAALRWIDAAVQRLQNELAGRLSQSQEKATSFSQPMKAVEEVFEDEVKVDSVEDFKKNPRFYSDGWARHGLQAKLEVFMTTEQEVVRDQQGAQIACHSASLLSQGRATGTWREKKSLGVDVAVSAPDAVAKVGMPISVSVEQDGAVIGQGEDENFVFESLPQSKGWAKLIGFQSLKVGIPILVRLHGFIRFVEMKAGDESSDADK